MADKSRKAGQRARNTPVRGGSEGQGAGAAGSTEQPGDETAAAERSGEVSGGGGDQPSSEVAQRLEPGTPIVFFDNALLFGHYNGIVEVMLSAIELRSHPAGPTRVTVPVANLKMNVAAALALRNALNGALLLAQPTPDGDRKN